jgi:hypothetical protein
VASLSQRGTALRDCRASPASVITPEPASKHFAQTVVEAFLLGLHRLTPAVSGRSADPQTWSGLSHSSSRRDPRSCCAVRMRRRSQRSPVAQRANAAGPGWCSYLLRTSALADPSLYQAVQWRQALPLSAASNAATNAAIASAVCSRARASRPLARPAGLPDLPGTKPRPVTPPRRRAGCLSVALNGVPSPSMQHGWPVWRCGATAESVPGRRRLMWRLRRGHQAVRHEE